MSRNQSSKKHGRNDHGNTESGIFKLGGSGQMC